ncbi:MAG TPA: selenide, water dikinase SelD [Stellaceae bacterium]|nr:selenide, water dikinase SelD [Stellaceae bacterium]
MQRNEAAAVPVVKDLVLVGGGHSHVAVIKRFGMKPLPGVRLTLVSRDVQTPYSGMLPGLIAGHYDFDAAHIDLVALCRFAGARFFHDEAVGLDLANRRVLCRARPAVPYDVLSLDVGAAPRVDAADTAGRAIAVKPIHRLLAQWEGLRARALAAEGPLRIAVVGAGAGGVELLLAIAHRLRAERRGDSGEFHLFTDAASILPSHGRAARRLLAHALAANGVTVHTGPAVTAIGPGILRTADGAVHDADEVLWATAAGAAPWLGAAGLATDRDGFVAVGPTLQSLSHEDVFAAGDIAAMVETPRPKSGVFAVRQGPYLAQNLRRFLLGQRLRRYRPQRRVLALVATGGRHAVASWGALAWEGDWVWRWKDRIDRRFVRRYNELPAMAEDEAPKLPRGLVDATAARAVAASAMRCGGCGAKIGAAVLTGALGGIVPLERADVLIGLREFDDAALVVVPPGMALIHSVDYFRALVDDPFVFGKIAANHCLGDIYAMGGAPQTALAIATVPFARADKVGDTLAQMMEGAAEVLREAGAALVGGHSGEGAELGLGFAVNGLVRPDRVLRKSGLRPGDRLVLTKPLGIGTLFAAHMRGRAKGRWIDGAIASMLQSSAGAASCLGEHGATACTDVTGFGLAGHLAEMLQASQVDAELALAALPLLEGAAATLGAGLVSTLQPQNDRLRAIVAANEAEPRDRRRAALFDPQTSGGLIAGIPADRAEACVAALRHLGYARAAIIGTVLKREGAREAIRLRP